MEEVILTGKFWGVDVFLFAGVFFFFCSVLFFMLLLFAMGIHTYFTLPSWCYLTINGF